MIEAEDRQGPKQVIFCPKCGAQHIDSGWHKKNVHCLHKCIHCGHKWSLGKRIIGVSTSPLTDVKFEDVTFYILEISCQIILGMNFLYDFSVMINPRERTLIVPSVTGTQLTIPTDANRKKLPEP